jgi:hypothetical protein
MKSKTLQDYSHRISEGQVSSKMELTSAFAFHGERSPRLSYYCADP